MFTTLLESKSRKQRSPAGMVVSICAHGLVIFIAVQATLHASELRVNPAQRVEFIEPKRDKPALKTQEPILAPTHKGFQTLTAPVNIPDVLPEIDLSRKPTNADDFRGTGVEGGRANGVAIAPPNANQVYSELQVEKPASLIAGSGSPHYPDLLKSSGVEGEVLVSFVVDTAGRVDESRVVILKATHTLFEAAVRAGLSRMRFLPAEVGGKKVRQQVQLPLVFHIVK